MNLLFYSISLLVIFQIIGLLAYLNLKASWQSLWPSIILLLVIGIEYANILVNDFLLDTNFFLFNYALDFLIGPALYFSVRLFFLEKKSPFYIDIFHLFPFLTISILLVLNPEAINVLRQPSWEWAPVISLLIYTLLSLFVFYIAPNEKGKKVNMPNGAPILKIILFCFLFNTSMALVSIYLAFNNFYDLITPINNGILIIDFSWVTILSFSLFLGNSHQQIESRQKLKAKAPLLLPKEKLPFYQALFLKAQKLVQEESLYTKTDLTLPKLASSLKTSTHELSAAINLVGQMNFYEWINQFRIQEAQELLKVSEEQDLRINEIMYKVGFRSRSSFNTSFKKHTGVTPSQFKRGIYDKKCSSL